MIRARPRITRIGLDCGKRSCPFFILILGAMRIRRPADLYHDLINGHLDERLQSRNTPMPRQD
jgi:hypothetical protein